MGHGGVTITLQLQRERIAGANENQDCLQAGKSDVSEI
jgi:hypothetical protein